MSARVPDLRKFLTSRTRTEIEADFEAAATSTYLGNNTILCRVLGDKKFFAIADDVGLTPHLVFDGYWEFWLTQYFARAIRTGDVVLDIGANLGYYTLAAADLVGPEGRVVAIEPNPAVYKLLCDNIAVNGYAGRTVARNVAIALEDGPPERAFFVPAGEPKNGRLLEPGEDSEALRARGAVTKVALGTIAVDDFDRVDFIKIDVEGAELHVLNHLQPIIARFAPKIVCEVNFGRGYTFGDIADVLGDGQTLKHLDYDGTVKPLTPAMAREQRIGDDWLVCGP